MLHIGQHAAKRAPLQGGALEVLVQVTPEVVLEVEAYWRYCYSFGTTMIFTLASTSPWTWMGTWWVPRDFMGSSSRMRRLSRRPPRALPPAPAPLAAGTG